MKDLKNTINHLQLSQSAKYRIKIQGRHNETWSDWMDDLEINIIRQYKGTAITVLTGIVRDQAGLHGLLNRIRDLSIPLISVQFTNPIYFEKEKEMKKYQSLVQVVLKAVALGMSVASMVLGYIGTVDTGTQVGLLSLGLFTLAVAALQNNNQ